MRAVVVAIAGGTGAGRTALAQHLIEFLGPESALLVPEDAHCEDQSRQPLSRRAALNHDHPDAFDTPVLIRHLERLRPGEAVPRMRYDCRAHGRLPQMGTAGPRSVVIGKGIPVLHKPALRALLDLQVSVHADADVRMLRGLRPGISGTRRIPGLRSRAVPLHRAAHAGGLWEGGEADRSTAFRGSPPLDRIISTPAALGNGLPRPA